MRANWIDEKTGRQITQLTDYPVGASVGYFRTSKHLPDGRVLAYGYGIYNGSGRGIIAIDPESGDIEKLDTPVGGYIRLRPSDGRMWYVSRRGDKPGLYCMDLPHGEPRFITELSANVPGRVVDITCDGRTLLYEEYRPDWYAFPIPTERNLGEFWRYLNRKRDGAIYTVDIETGRAGRLLETRHVCPNHTDTSPVDPTLIRYCEDTLEAVGQRMYTIRIDGSEPRVIRPQEYGEMITHEFWWSDPNLIGYTYMDRRGDDTIFTHPWCEYATRPARLGIADLRGSEVFLSDPLNSYHAHLYMSPDGRKVVGEGNADNNFLCVADFSMKDTRVDMKPVATIHTVWVPTRGCHVNAAFSTDGKWLIYNDTRPDGTMQICRVKAE